MPHGEAKCAVYSLDANGSMDATWWANATVENLLAAHPKDRDRVLLHHLRICLRTVELSSEGRKRGDACPSSG